MAGRALILLLISTYLTQKSDGNSVSLSPSPEASVKEGETLDLHCDYTGSKNPDFINFYLNSDSQGLVIDFKNCKFQTKPEVYRKHSFSLLFNETSVTLSIANISQGNNGDIWECDATITGMQPPNKTSTRIKVIVTDKADCKGGVNHVAEIPVVVIIVGILAGLGLLTIGTVVICLMYQRRKKDETSDQRTDYDVHKSLNKQPDPEEV